MHTQTDTALVLLLGVVSGALTTLAGVGGGMLLLLAIALHSSAAAALAVTAPALLLSNLHRAWVYRDSIARPVAIPFALGALPGSALGAALLTSLPTALVQGLMVAMTLLAFARRRGSLAWKPRASQLVPAGFVVGALAATSGGAGLLAAPLLMAAGLTAEPYVATAASGAVAMHVGRVLGYGRAGLLDERTLLLSAALTAALLVGNALGVLARRRIPRGASERVELTALTVSVALAIAGAAR